MANEAIVLFDGICNLCNGSVRFIAANDPAERFRFASLQSPQAAAALAPFGRDAASFESVVLIDGGRLYERSDAALRIAAELRPPFGIARAFLALPPAVRDAAYAWIANNRYRVFGRRESCALPTPELASRFLP
jgi:predicted DCC family thiol-disulfide oxidoreductase YuxK